jgi:hypothetical protein
VRLVDLYGYAERKYAVNVGIRREALPDLVRYVDLVGKSSTVLYSRIDERSI